MLLYNIKNNLIKNVRFIAILFATLLRNII